MWESVSGRRSRRVRVRCFCWLRGLITSLSVVTCSATLSSAAVFQFHWDRPPGFDGTAGPFFADDDAGILNSLALTYDADAQHLTFLAVFVESEDGNLPVVIRMIINDGPLPSGNAGEFALLKVSARGDDRDPVLKAYTYGGPPGHRQRIVSSQSDDTWINSASVNDVNDTRVFAFDIDVSQINSFEPAHGVSTDWFGIGFDDMIGMWMRTYAWEWPRHSVSGSDHPGLGPYRGWPHLERGYFDFANQPSDNTPNIPEPASAALFTFGLTTLYRRPR